MLGFKDILKLLLAITLIVIGVTSLAFNWSKVTSSSWLGHTEIESVDLSGNSPKTNGSDL